MKTPIAWSKKIELIFYVTIMFFVFFIASQTKHKTDLNGLLFVTALCLLLALNLYFRRRNERRSAAGWKLVQRHARNEA